MARVKSLSRSGDDTAWTDIWDCTAGTFEWRYEIDETVHILEGEVVVTDHNGTVWKLEPGDVILFRVGTRAHWHVPEYVRKVAFCRKALPRPIAALIKIRGRVRRRAAALVALAGLLAMMVTATIMLAE